jgi:dihydrofolate synthase/folylpolyglutamate synthase
LRIESRLLTILYSSKKIEHSKLKGTPMAIHSGIEKNIKQDAITGKTRSYNEVVDNLDARAAYDYSEASLQRIKILDKAFDNISKKIDTIIIGGSNGKSSTIHFASKLLKEEGFKVGASYSTHFLTYNERVVIEGQAIQNKRFTEIVNEVINAADQRKVDATAFEIMNIASLLYFKEEGAQVALMEVGMGGRLDATTTFSPLIAAVTKISLDHIDVLGNDLDEVAKEIVGLAGKGTLFICAEQGKLRLQKMHAWVDENGAQWVMPVRKLAALPYISEQLYGHVASLAEKITQMYVEDIKGKFSPFLRGNILATGKGQRGRPTLEAKREAERNPLKTLKSFWLEEFSLLRNRFELLDKEKPTILLDNAHNLDALDNLFLGIRLVHYQKALKGLTVIMGVKDFIPESEVIRLVRYLLKKVSGQIFFVPLHEEKSFHSPEKLAASARDMGIKAKGYKTFAEAFQAAKGTVDERNGLVCITGSPSLITAYWAEKGIKKLTN